MMEQLKSELEEIAFMLGEGAERKEIHSKVIKCLVIIERSEVQPEDHDNNEVVKVLRRLKMWAKPERQAQYNSKILNAYIQLAEVCSTNITEDLLNKQLNYPDWFAQNFAQMKSISDKNHGKVFDDTSGNIQIWEPIEMGVDQYRKQVFVKGI